MTGDTLAEKIKAMMNQIERSYKEGTANLVEARKVLEMIAGDLVGNSYVDDLLNEAKTILEMYETAAKENEQLKVSLGESERNVQEQAKAYGDLKKEYDKIAELSSQLQNRADVLETTIRQYLEFEQAMQKAGIDTELVTRYIQGDPRARDILFGLIKFKEDGAQEEIIDGEDLKEVLEEVVVGPNPLDDEDDGKLTLVEEEMGAVPGKEGLPPPLDAVISEGAGKIPYSGAGAGKDANPGSLVTAISSATAKNKKEEGSLALLSPEARPAYQRMERLYDPKVGFGAKTTKVPEYKMDDAFCYMVLIAAQAARPELEKNHISQITSVEVSEALATDIMTFLRDPAKSRYFSDFAQRIGDQAIKDYINGVVQDDCSASSPGAKIKLEMMLKPIYEATTSFLEDNEGVPGLLTSKMPNYFRMYAESINPTKANQPTPKTKRAK